MPRLFAALSDLGVVVQVTSANTASSHRSLLNDEIDAAILVAAPVHGSLVSHQLLRTRLVWVAHINTAVPGKSSSGETTEQTTLEEISKFRIAPYDFGEGFVELFEALAQGSSGSSGSSGSRGSSGSSEARRGRGVVSPLGSARRLVIDHQYLAFLPLAAVEQDLASGTLREILVKDSPQVTWDIRVVYRPRQTQTPAISRLAEVAQLFGGNSNDLS